jgi:hypothetical protein
MVLVINLRPLQQGMVRRFWNHHKAERDMAVLGQQSALIRCSCGRAGFIDTKHSLLIESQPWYSVVTASWCRSEGLPNP